MFINGKIHYNIALLVHLATDDLSFSKHLIKIRKDIKQMQLELHNLLMQMSAT